MISNNRFLFCVLFFLGIFQSVLAQEKWELKKQSDGIVIHTADFKGSDFKVFKAVTTISASGLNEIVAIILDVPNFKNLFPDILDCKILKKTNDGVITHYICNKAPWPVDDRDGIFELKPEYRKAQNEVVVSDNCIEYAYPKKEGTVRMVKGEGFWKITALKNNMFEITYQFHGEPAGKIPSWLANSFVVDQPYQTLKNLKLIIASGKYKNAKVDFLQ